ncbi:hypothetical protein H0178_20800 [Cytobacillus firmus]|nr:hypothetical protein [Cytobacillus firmus]
MAKYSEAFKQEIYRRLAAGETPRALAEETGASRRTLENWKAMMKKQNADSIEPEIELYVLEPETENEKETVELHSPLHNENSELKKAYADLKERHDLLIEKYNTLKNDYKLIKEDNDVLFDRYSAWRERG